MPDRTSEERQAIDPVFKQLLEEQFDAYEAKCQTEYEVNRLPRTIDALVTIEGANELQKVRRETPFFYFLKDNSLEFKGRNDRLKKKDYHAIRGRVEFLLHNKHISPRNTTSTIICAGKPHAVLEYTAQELERAFISTENKGYYRIDEIPPLYLIVVNELSIIPVNYPLLVFASSERKFRAFLEQIIAEGDATYIRYAYNVRPKETKEVLTMAGIPSSLTREDLEFMVDDIGDDMIAIMTPEKILGGMNREKKHGLVSLMSVEDRLADLSVEDRLADLSVEDRLANVSVTELLKAISTEQWQGFYEAFASSAVGKKERNGNGTSDASDDESHTGDEQTNESLE